MTKPRVLVATGGAMSGIAIGLIAPDLWRALVATLLLVIGVYLIAHPE